MASSLRTLDSSRSAHAWEIRVCSGDRRKHAQPRTKPHLHMVHVGLELLDLITLLLESKFEMLSRGALQRQQPIYMQTS
jgi:hypothetical protein